MKTISHPSSSSSRLLSSGGSSADEIEPGDDSITLDRWEQWLFGAVTADLVVAMAAMALLTWPAWIEEHGVSTDVLGNVALGSVWCGYLLLFVLIFYEKWKHMLARLPQQTLASDLV